MYLSTSLFSNDIAATPTVYYTSPAGTYTRLVQFSVLNTDAVSRTVQIYLCTSAAAPGLADQIVKNKTLFPGETWVPYQVLDAVLVPGATIQLAADAAGVVVAKASGIQQS